MSADQTASAASDDILGLDGYALAAAIRARELSPLEVVEATLDRIDRLDAEINSFTEVFHDQARAAARMAERVAGEDGRPLLGVPVSIKDHIWVAGAPATNGSFAFRNFVAPEDCGVVERLRAAGAIIVGKTNNPEFLLRSYTDNDVFGTTRNPWDLERTAGGSSGGSGAAVAAGMAPISMGTDGGGSIRIPASFCGVVGLKPTFGLIPKLPGFRGWPTLSTDGPMTRSVRDAGLALSVIAGLHPADLLSTMGPKTDFVAESMRTDGLVGLRVAYSEDFGSEPVDEEVRRVFRAAVERFAETGCELVHADPPHGEQLQGLWWKVVAPEIFASEGPLLAEYGSQMSEGIAEIVRSGEASTASDYLDAQHQRNDLARSWATFHETYDLLLAPTMQVTPFPVGQQSPDQVGGRPADPVFEDWVSMIYAANLTNQPALSVPIGFSSDGLPIGMQIIARRFEDGLALRAGAAWEQLSPWCSLWPPTVTAHPPHQQTASPTRCG